MKEKKQTLKSKKKLLPLVLISLLLFTLLIYWKFAVQEDDSQGTTNIDKAADQVEIVNFKDKLPDNYPEDMPVYGQVEIVSASASDSSVSVMWKTGDSVEDVRNYYNLKLKDKDWGYEVSETDEAVMYKLDKKEKTGFMVITNEDGITTITIAVGLE